MTPPLDVSGIVPAAREVARATAGVLRHHTRDYFVGLTCYGSCVRGGMVPGVSDIDFHLYLRPEIYVRADGHDNVLPLDLAIAIRRDLARIDPAPTRAIDATAECDFIPEGHIGPIPGNYHLIAGRLPVPEATVKDVRAAARLALTTIDPLPAFVSHAMLHHRSGVADLDRTVRRLTQSTWPLVYHALALTLDDPLAVWRTPRDRLLASIPARDPLGECARALDAAVRAYHRSGRDLDAALVVITAAAGVRESIAEWAARGTIDGRA